MNVHILARGDRAPSGHVYAKVGTARTKKARLLHLVPLNAERTLCGIDVLRGQVHAVTNVHETDHVCPLCREAFECVS